MEILDLGHSEALSSREDLILVLGCLLRHIKMCCGVLLLPHRVPLERVEPLTLVQDHMGHQILVCPYSLRWRLRLLLCLVFMVDVLLHVHIEFEQVVEEVFLLTQLRTLLLRVLCEALRA
jgi:hypothetical protein